MAFVMTFRIQPGKKMFAISIHIFSISSEKSAGILPFSCQERRGDDSPGWRQARPTAVGWEGGWGYAVTGQLSDSVRRR